MTGRKNGFSKEVVGGIRPCHTSKDIIGSMMLFEASFLGRADRALIILDEKCFFKVQFSIILRCLGSSSLATFILILC